MKVGNFNAVFPVFPFKAREILLQKLLKNEFCEAVLSHNSRTRRNLKGERFCAKIDIFEKVDVENMLVVGKNAWRIFWGNVFSIFFKTIYKKHEKNGNFKKMKENNNNST